LDWPEIRSRVHVNGVVTLVDGEALSEGSPVADREALERQRAEDPSLDHITAIDELFRDQLQAADLVLISRADTLSAAKLASVQAAIAPKVRPGTSLLPVSNGALDSSVVLGIEHQSQAHAHPHAHGDNQEHDHDHHDHSHVEVIGQGVRMEGDWDRKELESLLPELVRQHQVIRLKGRVWLAGKALPLQLQMVGPRLNSWFEAAPRDAWRPTSGTGADLVVLALNDAASSALESELQRLLNATPDTAKSPATIPCH
jgi:cobalamin biosynthesis protein CobW